mgnify:CR=1 FL=1
MLKDSEGNPLVLFNRYRLIEINLVGYEIILCDIDESMIQYVKVNGGSFVYTRSLDSITGLYPMSDPDILNDLSDLIKNDKRFAMNISFAPTGLDILLLCDLANVKKNHIITYDSIKAETKFCSEDFVDCETINIVNKIMEYINNHKEAIEGCCNKLAF